MAASPYASYTKEVYYEEPDLLDIRPKKRFQDRRDENVSNYIV